MIELRDVGVGEYAIDSVNARLVDTRSEIGEYAIDDVNARFVDTRSENRCHPVLKELVADHEA